MAEALQIISACASTGALLLAGRLSFQAGKIVKTVEEHDRRLNLIDEKGCRLHPCHNSESAD